MNKNIKVASKEAGMGYIEPLTGYSAVLPSGVAVFNKEELETAFLVAWLDGARHILKSWDAADKEKKKCRKPR